jgi:hypothetical protein
MRLKQLLVAIACVVCALFASTSEASPLTLTAQGHLTGVLDAAGLLTGYGFNVGDTFLLTVTFADPTPPPDADPSSSMFGSYSFSPAPSSVAVSGYTLAGTKTQILVTDGTAFPFNDDITINPFGILTSSVPSPAHFSGFRLRLGSGNTTTLTSDALDFGSSLWTTPADSSLDLVFFDDRIQGQQFASLVLGAVNSVSVTSVPEPGSLVLFGTGALALGARARRNSSRRRGRLPGVVEPLGPPSVSALYADCDIVASLTKLPRSGVVNRYETK